MKARILVGMILLATPAWAQLPGLQPTEVADGDRGFEQQRRVQQMEQVLEDAVTRGVRVVEQQLPTVGPQMLFFAGTVQARGFEIDGYGMFFDVEYPVVRRSLLWSMSALDDMDGGMSAALRDLRTRMSAMPGGPGQAALQAITEMEAQLEAAGATTRSNGRAGVRQAADADAMPQERRRVVDPTDVYMAALTGELSNALVRFGSALDVTGDQWISIGARDGRGRVDPRLAGPRETLRLRISGHDLDGLRQGRLSADEVRQRVESP